MNRQIPSISLCNAQTNTVIPIIGLGTSLVGRELTHILPSAFKFGFRLVDTAVYYENERYIGEVLDTGIIRRDELFLCTKVNF